MAGSPLHDSGNPGLVPCPSCTIQIPSGSETCPYCLRAVPRDPSRDFRRRLVPPEQFPALRRFWGEHGTWVKVAAPALAAALALWIAWGLWSGLRVKVPPDGAFLIEVEKKKTGPNVLLKGKLTNRGEDIPDLSLRSIGVIAEFRFRDGRTERRRFFPKSPYRGEGALLNGETGSFEIVVPKEVAAVSLRGEIVDLGEDRKFIPAGGVRIPPPEKKS